MTLSEAIRRLAPDSAGAYVPLLLRDVQIKGSLPSVVRHTDFHSLYIAEQGRGTHLIDNTPYPIVRGDVYVMGLGSTHTYAQAENLLLHALYFRPEIFDAETWQALNGMPGFTALIITHPAGRRLHMAPSAYADIARDFAELWSEWRHGSVLSGVVARALLLRLLVRLARVAGGERQPDLSRMPAARYGEEIIAAAVRTIDLNYHQPLRVEQLAADAHLSRYRFTELFTSVMGRTPRDYLRHVRLERAKVLLATTAMPIADIATASGFHQPASFTHAFRAGTGLTPRQYRQSVSRGRRPTR